MSTFATSANANNVDAWKAFDGTEQDSWVGTYTGTGLLTFTFDVPTEVKGVRIIPATSSSTDFPTAIVVKASDPTAEHTVQTLSMKNPVLGTAQEFIFDESVTERIYKFELQGNSSASIADIEFLVLRDVVIPQPSLQEKTVSPTTTSQAVIPDASYDGLSKVTVNGVSLQEKSVTPASSQQVVTPDSSHLGLSKVTIAAATLQEKTVSPTTSQQVITPDSGNYGLSKVTIEAAPAAATPKLQEKTVTPTTSNQNVAPDASYDGLSKVTVNAIPSTYTATGDATASASDIRSGKTAYAIGTKLTGTMGTVSVPTPSISISTNGLITASVSQSSGYTAGGSQSATSQMTTQAAKVWTPTTSNQTLSSGRYLTGTQTIQGDANLIPSNIKKDVSIFGVTGTYEQNGGSAGAANIPLVNITLKLANGSLPSATVKVYSPCGTQNDAGNYHYAAILSTTQTTFLGLSDAYFVIIRSGGSQTTIRPDADCWYLNEAGSGGMGAIAAGSNNTLPDKVMVFKVRSDITITFTVTS